MPCLFGTVSCNDCVEHVYGHSILDNTDIYLFYPSKKRQILCHRANNQIKIDLISTKSPRETSLDPVLMFTLRVGEVGVDDVWHVAGMCGTGSKDLRLDDVFVADAWVNSQSECFGPAPVGVRHNPDGYLFGVELISYLDSLHIGPVLDCAEGSFDECVAALRNRAGTKEGAAAKTHPILLERVAESAAQLSCARHL